jgi:hypothetical protein
MKFLLNIIKRFTRDPVKPLGRWNIDYCSKKIDHKVDLSNVDHCGPCGTEVLDETPKKITFTKKTKNDSLK